MKISTKGRYALRLMLDIADNGKENPVRIKDISASKVFLISIWNRLFLCLIKLVLLEVLEVLRVVINLTRTPEEYTVGSILRLTEGDLAPVACLEGGNNDCERSGSCVTLRVWKKINDAVNDVVDNITLKDLIDWEQGCSDNYVI